MQQLVPTIQAHFMATDMTSRFATYDDAIRYIVESTDYERMRDVVYSARTFRLDRVRALLEALGNPQRSAAAVHIAGTKGKGSTAAMVEAIVRAHGLRTGLYTSPHLVDTRERIQIDRQWIGEELMRQLTERLAEAVERSLPHNRPTYFEMLTAVGFMAFAESKVEVSVLEVGLGGRLDSTNVIEPQVTVITGISMDHMAQLGPDLASIAGEKAGIIKAGVPLVVAPQEKEAGEVILRRAAELSAPVVQVGQDVTCQWQAHWMGGRPASRVTVTTPRGRYADVELALGGRCQGNNASCAIAACELLFERLGRPLEEAAVRRALAAVVWEGRLQVLRSGDGATVVLDGAHNAASVRQVLESVTTYFPRAERVVLFGSAADKDIAGMMGALSEQGAKVYFTRTDNPRAADPAELCAAYEQAGGRCLGHSPDIVAGLSAAREAAGPAGVVLVCGSLYLVGEILSRRRFYGL